METPTLLSALIGKNVFFHNSDQTAVLATLKQVDSRFVQVENASLINFDDAELLMEFASITRKWYLGTTHFKIENINRFAEWPHALPGSNMSRMVPAEKPEEEKEIIPIEPTETSLPE